MNKKINLDEILYQEIKAYLESELRNYLTEKIDKVYFPLSPEKHIDDGNLIESIKNYIERIKDKKELSKRDENLKKGLKRKLSSTMKKIRKNTPGIYEEIKKYGDELYGDISKRIDESTKAYLNALKRIESKLLPSDETETEKYLEKIDAMKEELGYNSRNWKDKLLGRRKYTHRKEAEKFVKEKINEIKELYTKLLEIEKSKEKFSKERRESINKLQEEREETINKLNKAIGELYQKLGPIDIRKEMDGLQYAYEIGDNTKTYEEMEKRVLQSIEKISGTAKDLLVLVSTKDYDMLKNVLIPRVEYISLLEEYLRRNKDWLIETYKLKKLSMPYAGVYVKTTRTKESKNVKEPTQGTEGEDKTSSKPSKFKEKIVEYAPKIAEDLEKIGRKTYEITNKLGKKLLEYAKKAGKKAYKIVTINGPVVQGKYENGEFKPVKIGNQMLLPLFG